MHYEPPAIEHRERIDDPLIVGGSILSPTWKDGEDPAEGA